MAKRARRVPASTAASKARIAAIKAKQQRGRRVPASTAASKARIAAIKAKQQRGRRVPAKVRRTRPTVVRMVRIGGYSFPLMSTGKVRFTRDAVKRSPTVARAAALQARGQKIVRTTPHKKGASTSAPRIGGRLAASEIINPRIPMGDNYHCSVGWY